MRSLLTRALLAISFGHFVVDINANLLPVMLPVIRAEQGLTYAQVGLVMACFSTASSLAQPVLGFVMDRHGTKVTMALSVLWIGLLIGAAGSARSFPLLVGLVTLSGLGSAAYHPQGASNARFVGGARAATAISVFSLTGIAGFAIGPMAGTAVFSVMGLPGTVVFVPLGILSAAAILAFCRVPDRGNQAVDQMATVIGRPRIPVLALTALLLIVVSRAILESAVVAYTPQRFAEDLVYSSRVLFVILFGQAIGIFIGGLVSDRVGRRPIIVGTLLALVPLVYLFHTVSGPALLGVAAITGITMGAIIPVTIVMAQELLPRNVGVASGLVMGFAFGLGGAGVAGVGVLADHIGLLPALQLLALAPLVGAVIAATCPIYRAVASQEANPSPRSASSAP